MVGVSEDVAVLQEEVAEIPNVISFEISWWDIRMGRPMRPPVCPVALAAQRVYGGQVRVGWNSMYLNGKCFVLPKKVRRWVKRFDFMAWLRPLSLVWLRPIRVTAHRANPG